MNPAFRRWFRPSHCLREISIFIDISRDRRKLPKTRGKKWEALTKQWFLLFFPSLTYPEILLFLFFFFSIRSQLHKNFAISKLLRDIESVFSVLPSPNEMEHREKWLRAAVNTAERRSRRPKGWARQEASPRPGRPAGSRCTCRWFPARHTKQRLSHPL